MGRLWIVCLGILAVLLREVSVIMRGTGLGVLSMSSFFKLVGLPR